jgi:hypothetical protein
LGGKQNAPPLERNPVQHTSAYVLKGRVKRRRGFK